METLHSSDLARETEAAQAVTNDTEREQRLSVIREFVLENLDTLITEASTDYLGFLNGKLAEAKARDDNRAISSLELEIVHHTESLKEYHASVEESVEAYIDPVSGQVDIEKLKKNLGIFMREVFLGWYGKQNADKADVSMEVISPKDLDWDDMMKQKKSTFGECTMNPDTIGKNWAEISPDQVKSLAFSEYVGKDRCELVQYLMNEYPDRDKYDFPGIEYAMYLLDHQDETPETMKDGRYHHPIGSTFRGGGGHLDLAYMQWSGGMIFRGAHWLKGKWSDRDRVLVLEKK